MPASWSPDDCTTEPARRRAVIHLAAAVALNTETAAARINRTARQAGEVANAVFVKVCAREGVHFPTPEAARKARRRAWTSTLWNEPIQARIARDLDPLRLAEQHILAVRGAADKLPGLFEMLWPAPYLPERPRLIGTALERRWQTPLLLLMMKHAPGGRRRENWIGTIRACCKARGALALFERAQRAYL